MSEELTNEEVEAITAAMDAGNKLEAMKLYCRASGKGLKEAQDFVDRFDSRFQRSSGDFEADTGNFVGLRPEQVEAISEALANGNKIEAIKIYRDVTGKGLKASKDFIDALVPQLKQQDPARYARAGEGLSVGCGAKALLMLAGGGVGVWAVRLFA